MHAIDRKLLRDFRRLWAQALAIALVLACGVCVLMTTFGLYQALDDTRQAYYERNRFADVFASARRAPRTLLPEIAALPGVTAVEARVSALVILDLPGRARTAMGHVLSLPADGSPDLNIPILRAGRLPDPDAADEVAVNEPFARANGLRPGDSFEANLNGRKRALTVTGTLLSPEFIYTIGPGAMMPDNAGYGILWMPERAAAAAFDMTGAFNDIALKLDARARPAAVIDGLDALLGPFGGLGAYDRSAQISDSFISAELLQLKSMSLILPPIFFGITIFLLGMVLGRIITLDRSEIGLLKALGYSDRAVLAHYLLLSVLIAVVGILVGWGAGTWLTVNWARLYAQFFDFPYLIYSMSFDAYAVSGLLALASAVAGASRAALRAARLPPAVAMQPPAPPRFRHGLLDRALQLLRLSQSTMMILRSLMRWPVRAALTSLGIALAVAILVASNFFEDALDRIIDVAFYQGNRQDATLLVPEDIPETALAEIRRLPGVIAAEGQIFSAAILRHGHVEKRIPIEARRPGADLSRVVDGDGRVIDAPPGGVLLAERLAAQLGVRPGDRIEVEFLTGRRETVEVPVTGLVTQYFGLGAYMDAADLNRLFRQAPRITVANILLDPERADDLHRRAAAIPGLSGVIMLNEMRRSFQDTIQQNISYGTVVYLTIATLITAGVSYNAARIQLSERARELASLRILGFSTAEVSFILVGEVMLLALIAQPLGWLLGAGIAWLSVRGFTSDLYRIPLVLEPATFAMASLVVLAAALAAALVVRRRLGSLDLVAVMKTRE